MQTVKLIKPSHTRLISLFDFNQFQSKFTLDSLDRVKPKSLG